MSILAEMLHNLPSRGFSLSEEEAMHEYLIDKASGYIEEDSDDPA